MLAGLRLFPLARPPRVVSNVAVRGAGKEGRSGRGEGGKAWARRRRLLGVILQRTDNVRNVRAYRQKKRKKGVEGKKKMVPEL